MGGKQYVGTMEVETYLALMIDKGFATQEYVQALYNAVQIKQHAQLAMTDGHPLLMYKLLLVGGTMMNHNITRDQLEVFVVIWKVLRLLTNVAAVFEVKIFVQMGFKGYFTTL